MNRPVSGSFNTMMEKEETIEKKKQPIRKAGMMPKSLFTFNDCKVTIFHSSKDSDGENSFDDFVVKHLDDLP